MLFPVFLFGANFYWVNGTGNWSDTNHWAKSSGSTNYYNRIPSINDNVIFDSLSFTASGQKTTINISSVSCKNMDWSLVRYNPKLSGTLSDTINIYGNLTFCDSMINGFWGNIKFRTSSSGNKHLINLNEKKLNGNCYFFGDSSILVNHFETTKNIYHINGVLMTNNFNISCLHFNPDNDISLPIQVDNPVLTGNDTITIKGSIFLNANYNNSNFTGPIYFSPSNDTNYIYLQNIVLNNHCYFVGGGILFLKTNINTNKNIYYNQGTMFSNGFDISCNTFSSELGYSRSLNFNNSIINIQGAGNSWKINPSFLNMNFSGTVLKFNYSGNDTVNFLAPDTSIHYETVHFYSPFTILKSSNQYDTLKIYEGVKLFLKNGLNQYVNYFSAIGTCGLPVFICSSERGSRAKIIKTSGTSTSNYIRITDIEASGGALFVANNSVDEGNISGWTITEPSDNQTMYWIGGSGNWADATHWSYSSGGTNATCIPAPNNDVIFDNNSFSGNDTVFVGNNSYCKNMTWTALTTNPVLYGNDENYLKIKGSLSFDKKLNAAFTGNYYFSSNSNDSILSDSVIINGDLYFTNGGNYTLKDKLETNKDIYLQKGTFNLNNKNLSCEHFISNDTFTRQLNLGNSTITINSCDTAWNINSKDLNFISNSSTIILNHNALNDVVFNGADLKYDTLILQTNYSTLISCDSFDMIKNISGKSLSLESDSKIYFDSFDITGNCASPFVLKSTDFFGNPAKLKKTGYYKIDINNLIINNVSADTSDGFVYIALNSVVNKNTSGWTTSAVDSGMKYYWVGNSGNWSDTNHWSLSSGGVNTSCIPSENDSIVFDSNSFTLSGQEVKVDIDAYFSNITFSTVTNNPELNLVRNIFPKGNVTLSDNLSIVSPNSSAYIYLIPNGNVVFDPSGIDSIFSNIIIDSKNTGDSITITDNILMNKSNSISTIQGILNLNNQNISCGSMLFLTNNPKSIYLTGSKINLNYGWIILSDSGLTLHSDSSIINIDAKGYAFFNGENLSYNILKIETSENTSSTITGSNTFNKLILKKGVNIYFEANKTQTINDSFVSMGTCVDYINLHSTEEGTQAKLDIGTNAHLKGECLKINDIKINGSGSPFEIKFSTNEGNNSGWNFNSTSATTASFNVDYNSCFGEFLSFNNNSTAISGDSSDLKFTWYFDDGDTVESNYDTTHCFDLKGKHYITLKSTYINECFDTYTDSTLVYKPDLFISTDEPDEKICFGDNVTFMLSNTGDSFRYYVDDIPVTQYITDTFFSISTLTDGQTVKASVKEGDCYAMSNTSFKFTVDSIPNLNFVCSDSDQVICINDTVYFYAYNANLYQFYINGVSQGNMDSTNIFYSNNLQDGDTVSLIGKFSENQCSAESPIKYIFTVNPLPVVSLSSSDIDNTICSGDSVTFMASGAERYEFFINGISQGVADTTNTFTTTLLTDGATVTVAGTSTSGCFAISNNIFTFTVKAVPNVSLTSSDADNTICAGNYITFNTSGASQYDFFLNGVSILGQTSLNFYKTDSLQNNDIVSVKGYINNCSAFCDTSFQITVHPNVELTCSDTNQIICEGTEVEFNASGDTIYQFYLNNQSITSASSNSVFIIDSIKNGESISVTSTTGACLPSAYIFTVNPNPSNITLECDDADNLICDGDIVCFNTKGAFEYELFIDSVSYGQKTTNNTFVISTIKDKQNVYVSGYTDKGCVKNSSSITFAVNSYPNVSMICSDADNTICNGDSVLFVASGADSFEFFMDEVLMKSKSTDSTLYTNQLTNGKELKVVGTTKNCSIESDSSFQFTVFNYPAVKLIKLSDDDLCDGDTIKTFAKGANYYEYFIDGISQAVPSQNSYFSFLPTNAMHKLKVKGSLNGCSSISDSVFEYTISSYPVVNFSSSIQGNEICYGEKVDFIGSGAEFYEFYINGLLQNERTSDSIFSTTMIENNDEISLIAYNANCGVNADSNYKLKVHKMNIGFTNSSNTNMICESSPIIFKATGADEYKFFVDSISQTNFSVVDSFITNTLSDGEVVSILAKSNKTGCIQSSESTFRIIVMSSPVISSSSSTKFCEGDSIILFSNFAKGNKWFKDGNILNGQTDSLLIVKKSGDYSLEVVNGGNASVISFGKNENGQLGNGNFQNSVNEVNVLNLLNITDIDAGRSFNLALDSEKNVYSWGSNLYGQLGIGSYSDKNIPVKLNSLSQINKIASGGMHCIALKSDSTLLSWGNNLDGQLGYGNNALSNFPFAVIDIDNVIEISAGESHSLALKSDGTVWSWGDNRFGQLGNNNYVDQNKAVQVLGLTNIVEISAGKYHSLAIDENGKVWTWGNNSKGQLGTGNYNSSCVPIKIVDLINIVKIGAGADHSLALRSNGKVYAWGSNEYGQLGIKDKYQAKKPVIIDLNSFIKDIECGYYHNFATEEDYSTWAWGYNFNGQLGNKTTQNQTEAIILENIKGITKLAAGVNHSTAILGRMNNCVSSPINIDVDTIPEITINYDGKMLKTVKGSSYQWYFNGNEIPGATSQSFEAKSFGSYSVYVVFNNNCGGMSEVFKFSSIESNNLAQYIKLLPNPNKGIFNLKFELSQIYLNEITGISLFDVYGKELLKYDKNITNNILEFNIQKYGVGLYLLKINFTDYVEVMKVIVD